jgi:hypothetical protein
VNEGTFFSGLNAHRPMQKRDHEVEIDDKVRKMGGGGTAA